MQDEVKVTQADRIADAVAAIISEQVASEFKGFWAPEDLLEELPGMIRVAVCDSLTRHRQQAERDTLARMEWRDIESAPKDGTRFLAWCPYVGRVIMRIDGVHRETWAIDPSGRLGCNPTKWMPLPPAPEAGQ